MGASGFKSGSYKTQENIEGKTVKFRAQNFENGENDYKNKMANGNKRKKGKKKVTVVVAGKTEKRVEEPEAEPMRISYQETPMVGKIEKIVEDPVSEPPPSRTSHLETLRLAYKRKNAANQEKCLELWASSTLSRARESHAAEDYVKAAVLYRAARHLSEGADRQEALSRLLQQTQEAFVERELKKPVKPPTKRTPPATWPDLFGSWRSQLKDLDGILVANETGDVGQQQQSRRERERFGRVQALCAGVLKGARSLVQSSLLECFHVLGVPKCKYALCAYAANHGGQAFDRAVPELRTILVVDGGAQSSGVGQYFEGLCHLLCLKLVVRSELAPGVGGASLIEYLLEEGGSVSYDSVRELFAGGSLLPGRLGAGDEGAIGSWTVLADKFVQLCITSPAEGGSSGGESSVDRQLSALGVYSTLQMLAGNVEVVNNVRVMLRHQNKLVEIDSLQKLAEKCSFPEKANPKEELFGLPVALVTALCLYLKVECEADPVGSLEQLKRDGRLTEEAAGNLKTLLGISAELYLKCQLENHRWAEAGDQDKRIFSEAWLEEQLDSSSSSIFRFYSVLFPLLANLSRLVVSAADGSPLDRDLFGGDPLDDRREITRAKVLLKFGRPGKAAELMEGAEESASSAEDMLALAQIHSDNGNQRTAVEHYQRALGLLGEGGEHRLGWKRSAGLHLRLAKSYDSLGEYAEATNNYTDSLRFSRKLRGEEPVHAEMADLFENLGNTWHCLGDLGKAVEYYEDCLEMRRCLNPEEVPGQLDLAAILSNIGGVWEEMGDLERALKYLTESLRVKWAVYGREAANSDLAMSLANLGRVWHSREGYQQAVAYSCRALAMKEKEGGVNVGNSETATLLTGIARSWEKLGQFGKAIEYHQKALQTFRNLHGSESHSYEAECLTNIGRMWGLLEDHQMAVAQCEQALAIFQEIYGEEDTQHPPAMTQCFEQLGSAWFKLGDHDKAIKYFESTVNLDY